MAIAQGYVANFETLRRAAADGMLALTECSDIKTGEPVIVVTAMNPHPDGGYTMVPLAKMFDGNPYEEVMPVDAQPKS